MTKEETMNILSKIYSFIPMDSVVSDALEYNIYIDDGEKWINVGKTCLPSNYIKDLRGEN